MMLPFLDEERDDWVLPARLTADLLKDQLAGRFERALHGYIRAHWQSAGRGVRITVSRERDKNPHPHTAPLA